MDAFAASEDVDRGVAVLGPDVDREMRFADDDHPGNAPGRELMKHRVDNRCARHVRCVGHRCSDPVEIIQAIAEAFVQVNENLTADAGARERAIRDRCRRRGSR